jgi:putative Mg2+ transporter-C (MgtC) family protein
MQRGGSVLNLGEGEMVLRVLLAVVLGAAIGVEREIDAQPAGFRTHVLLCVGAALFGLISVHAFAPFVAVRAKSNVQIDITRVASQVVVGVGFLGGGAILKQGGSVRGLTTAASMWVTAAIGLAVGLGYTWAAVAVTVAALLSLVVFRWVRRWIRTQFGRRSEIVSFRLSTGEDPAALVSALHGLRGVSVRSLHVETDEASAQCEVVVGLKTEPRVNLDEMLATLAQRADVEELSLDER